MQSEYCHDCGRPLDEWETGPLCEGCANMTLSKPQERAMFLLQSGDLEIGTQVHPQVAKALVARHLAERYFHTKTDARESDQFITLVEQQTKETYRCWCGRPLAAGSTQIKCEMHNR